MSKDHVVTDPDCDCQSCAIDRPTRVSPPPTSDSASFQELLSRLRKESGLPVEDARSRAEQTRLRGLEEMAAGTAQDRVTLHVGAPREEYPGLRDAVEWLVETAETGLERWRAERIEWELDYVTTRDDHPDWTPSSSELRPLVESIVLSAGTIEECDEAADLMVEYMDATGDTSIRSIGGALARMRDALRLIADGRGHETDPAKLHLPPYERGEGPDSQLDLFR